MARSQKSKTKIRGLSLTRKPGEQITIYTTDGPITVQIGETRGHNTRIKIDAPPTVKIFRSELDVLSPKATASDESDYD